MMILIVFINIILLLKNIRKKAKLECKCDLSKCIYVEKLLNSLDEDYNSTSYNYQDVLKEIVLDELKQEKELLANLKLT